MLAALLWLAVARAPARPAGADRRARRAAPGASTSRRSRSRCAARASRDVALAPVQAAARAQVIRRAALAPDAPDDAVRDAALRLGFEEDEAAALMGERGADEALALGRALARGRR